MDGPAIAMWLINRPETLIKRPIFFDAGAPTFPIAVVVASVVGAAVSVAVRTKDRVVIGVGVLHLVFVELGYKFLVTLSHLFLHLRHLRMLFTDELVGGVPAYI